MRCTHVAVHRGLPNCPGRPRHRPNRNARRGNYHLELGAWWCVSNVGHEGRGLEAMRMTNLIAASLLEAVVASPGRSWTSLPPSGFPTPPRSATVGRNAFDECS